jgi:hypothetical protein
MRGASAMSILDRREAEDAGADEFSRDRIGY